MPQEIEVRYILPAIRRELASILIKDYKKSQKEVANVLGLTEAAISQYQHSKRVINEIRKSADKILAEAKNKQRVVAEIYRISNLTKVRHILCDLHRSQSKDLKDCNICFEDDLLAIKTK